MSLIIRALGLALMIAPPLAVVLASRWVARRWPRPAPETARPRVTLGDLVYGSVGAAWLFSGAVWLLLALLAFLAPALALVWLVAR